MNSKAILFSVVVMMIVSPLAFSATASDVVGRWYTEGNESQVEIYTTKDSKGVTRYSGKLIWFENPVYDADDAEAGKKLHDRENPDAAHKADPLLGLNMLSNFTFNASDGVWDSGTIYDPNKGKTYKCVMTLAEGGKKLDVRGYVGAPMFGRTTQWVRVTKANDKAELSSDD